jgi:hypothetical protein
MGFMSNELGSIGKEAVAELLMYLHCLRRAA